MPKVSFRIASALRRFAPARLRRPPAVGIGMWRRSRLTLAALALLAAPAASPAATSSVDIPLAKGHAGLVGPIFTADGGAVVGGPQSARTLDILRLTPG